MNTWEIVALPQGDEIMKNGKVADTREAERILNNHERLVEVLRNIVEPESFDMQVDAIYKARTLLDALEAEKGGEL